MNTSFGSTWKCAGQKSFGELDGLMYPLRMYLFTDASTLKCNQMVMLGHGEATFSTRLRQ